ncbi:uncharacterized protein LOC144116365 [Amblyomma americanum]|uniref:Uncharacterized protein n=1 Tax=Amblyomma americanum TaxID=6943 RepID=A0AAQ4E5J7_AMBAM
MASTSRAAAARKLRVYMEIDTPESLFLHENSSSDDSEGNFCSSDLARTVKLRRTDPERQQPCSASFPGDYPGAQRGQLAWSRKNHHHTVAIGYILQVVGHPVNIGDNRRSGLWSTATFVGCSSLQSLQKLLPECPLLAKGNQLSVTCQPDC